MDAVERTKPKDKFVNVDGQQLRYIEEGSGPSVLFLHGASLGSSADVFLRKATVEYLGSARYDDELSVMCRVAALGRTSMTMRFEIWGNADEKSALLVTADLIYVNVDAATKKPAPLPDELRQRVRDYERTAPVEAERVAR